MPRHGARHGRPRVPHGGPGLWRALPRTAAGRMRSPPAGGGRGRGAFWRARTGARPARRHPRGLAPRGDPRHPGNAQPAAPRCPAPRGGYRGRAGRPVPVNGPRVRAPDPRPYPPGRPPPARAGLPLTAPVDPQGHGQGIAAADAAVPAAVPAAGPGRGGRPLSRGRGGCARAARGAGDRRGAWRGANPARDPRLPCRRGATGIPRPSASTAQEPAGIRAVPDMAGPAGPCTVAGSRTVPGPGPVPGPAPPGMPGCGLPRSLPCMPCVRRHGPGAPWALLGDHGPGRGGPGVHGPGAAGTLKDPRGSRPARAGSPGGCRPPWRGVRGGPGGHLGSCGGPAGGGAGIAREAGAAAPGGRGPRGGLPRWRPAGVRRIAPGPAAAGSDTRRCPRDCTSVHGRPQDGGPGRPQGAGPRRERGGGCGRRGRAVSCHARQSGGNGIPRETGAARAAWQASFHMRLRGDGLIPDVDPAGYIIKNPGDPGGVTTLAGIPAAPRVRSGGIRGWRHRPDDGTVAAGGRTAGLHESDDFDGSDDGPGGAGILAAP
ncbi:hypothetical protein IBTHAUMO2_1050025 [Nitrosopumilaceae archaeon]|nr:hypothetical protein IBTHAUMO2_1050025 [Nitrosopumilaceae archaeon]